MGAARRFLMRFDGAAMTEFCLREGLTRSSFSLWRSRLRTDPLRTLAVAVAKSMAKPTALAPMPSFVDLGLLGAAAPAPAAAAAAAAAAEHAGLELRIELGGGLSLYLVRR